MARLSIPFTYQATATLPGCDRPETFTLLSYLEVILEPVSISVLKFSGLVANLADSGVPNMHLATHQGALWRWFKLTSEPALAFALPGISGRLASYVGLSPCSPLALKPGDSFAPSPSHYPSLNSWLADHGLENVPGDFSSTRQEVEQAIRELPLMAAWDGPDLAVFIRAGALPHYRIQTGAGPAIEIAVEWPDAAPDFSSPDVWRATESAKAMAEARRRLLDMGLDRDSYRFTHAIRIKDRAVFQVEPAQWVSPRRPMALDFRA